MMSANFLDFLTPLPCQHLKIHPNPITISAFPRPPSNADIISGSSLFPFPYVLDRDSLIREEEVDDRAEMGEGQSACLHLLPVSFSPDFYEKYPFKYVQQGNLPDIKVSPLSCWSPDRRPCSLSPPLFSSFFRYLRKTGKEGKRKHCRTFWLLCRRSAKPSLSARKMHLANDAAGYRRAKSFVYSHAHAVEDSGKTMFAILFLPQFFTDNERMRRKVG